jgi:hypothetical protein
MKSMSRNRCSLLAIILAATALVGCAATPQQSQEAPSQGGITQQEHQAHHPQGATGQAAGVTGQGATVGQGGMMGGAGGQGGMMGQGAGGQMGMMGQGGQMDMKSMCDLHEKMKNATPQQRSAMMDQYMKNMTPEMRQRHFQMMDQQCK